MFYSTENGNKEVKVYLYERANRKARNRFCICISEAEALSSIENTSTVQTYRWSRLILDAFCALPLVGA